MSLKIIGDAFILMTIFSCFFILIYIVITIINNKYGNNIETKTIIKEQPIIIKIEGGLIQQKNDMESISVEKKELNNLSIQNNSLLKNKKIDDIKIETSFSNGKRIGQVKK